MTALMSATTSVREKALAALKAIGLQPVDHNPDVVDLWTADQRAKCREKAAHDTRESARLAIHLHHKRRGRGRDKHESHPYHCRFCGKWHSTKGRA